MIVKGELDTAQRRAERLEAESRDPTYLQSLMAGEEGCFCDELEARVQRLEMRLARLKKTKRSS